MEPATAHPRFLIEKTDLKAKLLPPTTSLWQKKTSVCVSSLHQLKVCASKYVQQITDQNILSFSKNEYNAEGARDGCQREAEAGHRET